MKQLVEYIARALVDNPDKVEVNEIVGEKLLMYEIKVGDGDLGKIIGKEGRTAKAIRSIVAAAAMKQGKRAQVEILEPEKH
jgi:hypothetical protein